MNPFQAAFRSQHSLIPACSHARRILSLLGVAAALLLSGCAAVPLVGNIGNGSATGTATAALSSGASLSSSPLSFPDGFMPSVKSYGALGDGVTDDTAAIQAALADGRSNASVDYYGKPKALYFPPGTYLVHDTLQWIGCCVTLQGAGAGSSIIRLAPGSAGFGVPSAPKPLILTPAGNESFHQNIWDIAFSIGPNNPGATAISYISNNTGAIHNVLVTSEDGSGVSGIDLTRRYAGPLMIRNTKIVGFDAGIDLKNSEYGATLEAISLVNQNVAGIRDVNQPLSIRDLSSTNTVPALTNHGGLVVLLDATLGGGAAQNSALVNDSSLYLRNVSSAGYGSTLANSGGAAPATVSGAITEMHTGNAQMLSAAADLGSLKLDVAETPSFTEPDLTQWAAFTPRSYGDTAKLQSVFNSGKDTIYFPFGSYFSYNEAAVTVPDSVDRIVGFTSVVNGSSAGVNGGGIRLIVDSNSAQPLVIEQFGYGLKIDHRGSRPVVIKDARVTYTSRPGAGQLFLEDVESAATLTLQPGQKAWARQLDDEVAGTKIANDGANLWVMGLKTERAGTIIDTEAGGQTELLGAMIYPAVSVSAADVAFRSTDSKTSYIYTESVYCGSCGYSTQVEESRSGVDRTIQSSPGSNFRMPLFVGYP